MSNKTVLKGLIPLCYSKNIDKKHTNATLIVGSLEKKEKVFVFDSPWEGNHCVYQVIMKDDDKYVMYYLAHDTRIPFTEIRVCRAVSNDLLTWERPSYGIREFNGSKDNNIILDATDQKNGEKDAFFDNFFVFKDTNPSCAKDAKYKALAYKHPYQLETFFSKDGISFKRAYQINVEGKFDTLNTCFYDNEKKKYFMFIRDFHDVPENGDLNSGIRDIRVAESSDFKRWSKPRRLIFGKGKEDFPLYTNNIMKYPSNGDYLVGFPARYIERKEWTDNYDKLCGKESRLKRMEQSKRYGLAITDCLFMISKDGLRWERFDEALITPGIENDDNWVYGDGYLSYGMFEDGNYYSLFMGDSEWSEDCSKLYRHTIRKDGFAYYYAPYKEKRITLNKSKYIGGKIRLNFSTSAAGCVFVEITDGVNSEVSCEMFGDSVDREISISEEKLKKFIEKDIIVTVRLKDAKVYAVIFE